MLRLGYPRKTLREVGMNLYLDTEFDGHNGELISLALAAEEGKHWYGINPDIDQPNADPWVKDHVLPVLHAMPETAGVAGFSDRPEFRASLKEYLLARPGATIWADWPADFEWLMAAMCGDSYAESFMIPCTMQLIVTPVGEPKPEVPHNALSDAIALMDWHKRQPL